MSGTFLTRPARLGRLTAALGGSVLLLFSGCSTAPQRALYSQQEQGVADVPGIPGARLWADDSAIARAGRRSTVSPAKVQQPIVLAL